MSNDAFRQLRRRQDDLRNRLDHANPSPGDRGGYFSGIVFNNGSMPSSLPGQFAVQPVIPSGAETEAGALTLTGITATRIVTVVGTSLPVAGDRLKCYLDGGRWVAEKGGTSGTPPINLPGCPCTAIPATLHMTVGPDTNAGALQNCTIQYGPTPPAYAPLALGPNSFLSTAQFHETGSSDMFNYYFFCFQGLYEIGQVYITSVFGSPFRGPTQVKWAIGFAGNTCSPFLLSNGVLQLGYSPQTVVLSG